MSYGLRHPTPLPPRSRKLWGRGLRTPSTVAGWAVAEVVSHVVSGLAAFAFFAIAAGILLAIVAVLGPTVRGSQPSWLTGPITMASLGAMIEVYRTTRRLSRPSPPPPIETPSGRSSPLYDHDLDGGPWS